MPSFKLISSATCPFVQRSAITLEHKGVRYETEFIDLADKPAWFLERSPLGKVPVLIVRDDEREIVLFESAVINEYLDEITEGSLLPTDPLVRARHRAMIELGSAAIADIWRMGTAATVAESQTHAEALRTKLAHFERELVGPFFTGDSLSLVDTAAIPMLQRALWIQQVAPQLRVFEGLSKVEAWYAAAMELEAVERSTVPDVREQFIAYIAQRSDSWIARTLAA